ncbi:MAG: DUF1571 domain-containing protein [Planctomycetaceae bacterium]|nr:DUF1571 domain-containing protein [Planctomycetaceae bacterium]
MVPATDSALMCPSRWVVFGFGLVLSATDLGCARMSPFRDTRPMLGAVETKPGGKGPGGGDLYANHVGPGAERSRMLLARETSRSQAAGDGPSGVALQPPVMVPPLSDTPPVPGTPPALASNATLVSAPKPEELSGSGRGEMSEAAPGPGPSAPAPLLADDAPAASESTLETILAESRTKLDSLATYQVSMSRQERVGNTLQDPEDIVLSVRRHPMAVRLEWREGPHKGREVIYASDANGGLMHINTVGGLVPVPRIALPVDSPMVLKSARHPITEAGFDTILANMATTLELTQKGDESRGRLSDAGVEDAGPQNRPCHKIIRVTPSGETWMVFLDLETKLPVMVQANAANGDLLERYSFGDPKVDLPELASADAFDPDRRWGPAPAGGLMQRLARATSAKATATTPQ